jgi:hypothetical protein
MEYKPIPSTEFRVKYHVLDEPVEVTVLGRVIGRYIPSPYGRYWEPDEELVSATPLPCVTVEEDEVIPEDRITIIPAEEKA